jgi:hypothetical protein
VNTVVKAVEYKGYQIKECMGTIGQTKKAKKYWTVNLDGIEFVFSARFFATAVIDQSLSKKLSA